MTFLLGAITALVILSMIRIVLKTSRKDRVVVRLSQSQIYASIIGLLKSNEDLKAEQRSSLPLTQSQKHALSQYTTIFVAEGKAYWIDDGQLVIADYDYDYDEIDLDTKQQVDTIGMSNVELKKILFIVDKLKEGAINDNRNAG